MSDVDVSRTDFIFTEKYFPHTKLLSTDSVIDISPMKTLSLVTLAW